MVGFDEDGKKRLTAPRVSANGERAELRRELGLAPDAPILLFAGRVTPEKNPVFVVEGVIHYCVANMPGGVPITSTMALTNATLPYVEAIAGQGLAAAAHADSALARGVNVVAGAVTHEAVAEAHGLPYTRAFDALAGRR